MLKGKHKGIIGENIRELKSKGMSERDAVMVSMKNEKKSKKSDKVEQPKALHEDYPYGTRLELDHETLKKLGHTKLPAVGTKMHIHARAKVTSASENSSEGQDSPRRSVSLQITHMRTDTDHDAAHEPDSDYDDGSDDSREE